MMTAADANVRLLVEALEDRLVPSWLGAPPASITPTAAAPNAKLTSAGRVSGTGSINSDLDVDYLGFLAPVSQQYVIRTATPENNLDTMLAIYDVTGQLLTYNDDCSTGSTDSRLAILLTAGQQYFIGIGGARSGSYQWRIAAASGDDRFEQNDQRHSATDLGIVPGSVVVEDLVLADQRDWYRFTLDVPASADAAVRIRFQDAQGNLNLTLSDVAAQTLAVSTVETDREEISLAGLSAGSYFVRVSGVRNPHYTLEIDDPSINEVVATGGENGFTIELAFSGLSTTQIAVFGRAASRWQEIIVGDLPDRTYNGRTVDDLFIQANVVSIDGRGGVLGQASPMRYRFGSWLPYVGLMEFDAADVSAMEKNGSLYDVILHEMGHVLGIGTLWATQRLLIGADGRNPLFAGVQATAEYQAIFHQPDASGVPVESDYGAGSRDCHWDEQIFGDELMSPLIGGAGNPLSRITVASLADLGYEVNLEAADPFSPDAWLPTTSSNTGEQSGSAGASVRESGGCGARSNFSARVERPLADLWHRGSCHFV